MISGENAAFEKFFIATPQHRRPVSPGFRSNATKIILVPKPGTFSTVPAFQRGAPPSRIMIQRVRYVWRLSFPAGQFFCCRHKTRSLVAMPLSLTDVLLWPVDRPDCARCRSAMNLTVITPGSNSHEKRLFECPNCRYSETKVVNEPMTSKTELSRSPQDDQGRSPSVPCSKHEIGWRV